MTLLHSASKGHLLSAFPYGQDQLLTNEVATSQEFLLNNGSAHHPYLGAALSAVMLSCLHSNNGQCYSTRVLMTFPCRLIYRSARTDYRRLAKVEYVSFSPTGGGFISSRNH